MDTPDPLAELSRRLQHPFADRALLERALSHASYANEHPPAGGNEGLALLGDAALALVVAEHLLGAAPETPVGVLTPSRAALVSGANLARWAAEVGLGPLLRLGRSLEAARDGLPESVLATAFEAVLGVVYLEGGLDAVRRVVGRLALW